MDPINIGDTSAQQIADSGVIVVGDTTRRTVVFEGDAAEIAYLQPSNGGAYDTNWIVTSSQLDPDVGGTSKLTINLVLKVTGEGGIASAIETTWQIEWQRLEKPLTENPLLIAEAGEGDPPDPDRKFATEVESWKSAPDIRKRKYQIAKWDLTTEPDVNNDSDWYALTGVALKIATKIMRGVESFVVFHPVVTKNSTYSFQPITGDCGAKETPAVNVAGYQYLKTADSIVQQPDKSWKRTEQWTGATEWDPELYAEA